MEPAVACSLDDVLKKTQARVQTDLREAHPDLRLIAEHLVMEYGPVIFKSHNEQLWVPSSAE